MFFQRMPEKSAYLNLKSDLSLRERDTGDTNQRR